MTTRACPSCGVINEGRPVGASGQYILCRCASCDLVFSDPMAGADPQTYRAAEAHIDYWTHECALSWHHRRFLSAPAVYGRRLLDVGCGAGEFICAAAEKGYEVWGVDFVAEKVEVARKRRGLENVFAMSVDSLGERFPHRGFDVVTCFEVLEHLEDPAGFIMSLRGLLNPGAYLALSVPNRDRTLARFDRQDGPPHHLTRWSFKSLASLLERNGAVVVAHETKKPDPGGWLTAKTGSSRLGAVASLFKPLFKLLPFTGRGLYVMARFK
ncbi:MAG: class I SAM-dependent methyltransferase [Deltaproteobacteria bacterium]|nr:class I SAM-dependent methyltransferase [Deltaproteobacteria bacterium]